MRTLASALCLLLLSASSAAYADSATHWVQITSPHFIVISDSNEKQARHTAGQFEKMREIFHILLPNSTAQGGPPMVILALKDKKGFQALEPSSYLAKGSIDLAGFFMTAPDKNYILLRLDASGDHPLSVIYHEYTHFMVRRLEWIPLWMNEGMAEFYQNTTIEDKDVLLGQPSEYDILFLREHKLLPLPTLFAVDHSSPYYHDEEKGSIFYSESWALMHLIRISDEEHNSHRLLDYSRYMSQGEGAVAAAQHAFGDLNLLQKELDAYVQNSQYKMFKMSKTITVDEAAFTARSLPTPDADAIRADVLLYNERPQDAQALLDTVLRDDPKNEQAHETMGYLEFRAGDIAAAKKWYAEAVQLNSQSYLAHYYFAVFSMHPGDTTPKEAIESSLLQSIKLNPAFGPAYDALARFYGTNNEKLDDAHMLMVHAVQLEPENFNYRLNASSIQLQQQNFISALAILKSSTKVAKSPNEIETLNSRIHQVEQMQAFAERPARSAPTTAYGATTNVTNQVNGESFSADPEPEGPKYPDVPPTGAHHTVNGVLHSVKCSYPTVLSLNLDQPGKSIALYSNNYFALTFTTANFKPSGDLDPCRSIDGMKASIVYAEVTDRNVAGQLISIELSK